MGFYHRKLLDNTTSDIDHCTETYCNTAYDNLLPVCPPSCLTICPGICLFPITTLNSSPPPPPTTPRHIPTLFICMIVFFSASIFLASCLVSVKVYKARRLRRRSQPSNVDDHDHGHDGRDEFFDEVRGPHVLDHPIWYINTVGLEPSVISAITVCKYKRGEGIFIDEGIDSSCAVCLNEFVEDENLRILPKCNHAFHISCIDTWLRSHTNCPMCRAPVVTNTTAGQAPRMLAEPSGTVGNNSAEEGEENSRNSNGELNGEVEGENHQVKSNMVRSVSLDYLSGLKKISGTVALANDAFQLVSNSEIHESSEVCEMGSTSSSSSSSSASTSSSTAEGSRSMRRSVSCGGRFIGSIQSRQN